MPRWASPAARAIAGVLRPASSAAPPNRLDPLSGGYVAIQVRPIVRRVVPVARRCPAESLHVGPAIAGVLPPARSAGPRSLPLCASAFRCDSSSANRAASCSLLFVDAALQSPDARPAIAGVLRPVRSAGPRSRPAPLPGRSRCDSSSANRAASCSCCSSMPRCVSSCWACHCWRSVRQGVPLRFKLGQSSGQLFALFVDSPLGLFMLGLPLLAFFGQRVPLGLQRVPVPLLRLPRCDSSSADRAASCSRCSSMPR